MHSPHVTIRSLQPVQARGGHRILHTHPCCATPPHPPHPLPQNADFNLSKILDTDTGSGRSTIANMNPRWLVGAWLLEFVGGGRMGVGGGPESGGLPQPAGLPV